MRCKLTGALSEPPEVVKGSRLLPNWQRFSLFLPNWQQACMACLVAYKEKPMKSVRRPLQREVRTKARTGIAGFDAITDGGLPRGRTTLLVGGPGSGKTIFALQFLVHGAQEFKEPGIFVTFEESSKHIV